MKFTIVVLVLLGGASFLEFREWSEGTLRELWDFVVLGGPRVFGIPNTGDGYSWSGWKWVTPAVSFITLGITVAVP